MSDRDDRASGETATAHPDKTSSAAVAMPTNPVDLASASFERLRLGDHVVEIRTIAGHQDLTVDGSRERYTVSSSGFTLHAAGFTPPQPTLLDAVATRLGLDASTAEVLTRRFQPDFAADPDENDEVIGPPPGAWCGRKNFLNLNPVEREKLASALNAAYDDGVIGDYVAEHADSVNRVHLGSAFLPWHRHLLLRFESMLRSYEPGVRLAYWNPVSGGPGSDLEAPPLKSFFGGRDNEGGQVHWQTTRWENGSGGSPHTLGGLAHHIAELTYARFRQAFEWGPHAEIHNWVGGDMASLATSARDPLFYLHHCNVDRLWAYWQQNHPDAEQYTWDDGPDLDGFSSAVPLTGTMAGGATPQSMLDHTSLGVIYYPDPELEAAYAELEHRPEGSAPSIETGDRTRRMRVSPGVSFGQVAVGDIDLRSVRVSNIGSDPFRVTVEPSGEADRPMVWSGYELGLRPCQTKSIPVEFRPTTEGGVTRRMRILSDSDDGSVEVRVSGVGADFEPQ